MEVVGKNMKTDTSVIDALLKDLERSTWAETHPGAFKDLLSYRADMEGTVSRYVRESLHQDQLEGYSPYEFTHLCGACEWPYTPAEDEPEDCPQCGYDGKG